MFTFLVEVNWQGSTYKETIQASNPANAKKAALARYPGSTLRRIVRI